MDTARVQKPADSAPAAPAKKTPFFQPAPVQPKLQVHKPEDAAHESPAHAAAPSVQMQPAHGPASVQPNPATAPADPFFKPAVAPVKGAIIRNLYEPKPTGAETPQASARSQQPEPVDKQAATAPPQVATAPVINIADRQAPKTDNTTVTSTTPETSTQAAPATAPVSAKTGIGATPQAAAGLASPKTESKGGGAGKVTKAAKPAVAPPVAAPKPGTVAGKAGKGPTAITATDTASYLGQLQSEAPTDFMKNVQSSDKDIAAIQRTEKTELAKDMPVIDQPTGVPTLEQQQKIKATAPAKAIPTDLKLQSGGKKETVDIKDDINTEKPVVKAAPPLPVKINNQAAANQALSNAIDDLPVTDDDVPDTLGPRPALDLSGESDPGQVDQQNQTSDTDIASNEQDAQAETTRYFGENDIFPHIKPVKLKSKTRLAPPSPRKPGLIEHVEVSAEVSAGFDLSAAPVVQQHLDEQMADNDTALEQMHQDQKDKHDECMQEISDETASVRAQQLKTQAGAKAEVDGHRRDWQAENEQIKQDYADGAKTEREKAEGDINKQIDDSNKQIDDQYAQSESQIAGEKQKAKNEAAKKKKEAEEEQKSGGFFSAIGDFLSDVWDSIKDAVNFIFDKLKQFVKDVIDKVKSLVNKIIDAVRDLVVGLIKAFGAALKVLVDVALAAFPETRKKFDDRIDTAVDTAVGAVNDLADGLKKAVDSLLDALGAALDFILSAYQAAFNAIIDVLKFLTAGLYKILQGLANLVEAAWDSQDYIFGALSEQAIGSDVTEPLPNIERTDAEIAEFAKKYGNAGAGGQAITPHETAGLLAKDTLTSGDVAIGSQIELEPEILQQASLMLADKDTVSLGGAGDTAVTTDALRSAALGQVPGTGGPTEGNDVGVAAAGAATDPDWLHMTDDQKLDYQIDRMSQGNKGSDIDPKKDAGKPQNDPEVPIEVKTGRLAVTKRLSFVGRQMIAGMKGYWNQNKGTIIAALAGAFVVGGVVAFFTGGAGLVALLEVLMDIMMVYFLAQAALEAGDSIMDYLKLGYTGYIKPAAKSLAKGFAIIAVNFLLDYVLEGVGEVLEDVKNAIKSTKAFEKAASTGSKILERGRKIATDLSETGVGKAITKGGKYVIGGIEKGVGKGVKEIEELRSRVLKAFGFKDIQLRKNGHWLEIWAEFNPWVLLAKGELVEVESTGEHLVGEEGSFMTKAKKGVKSKEVDGILVTAGKDKNAFTKAIGDEGKQAYKDLKALDSDVARNAKIFGGPAIDYEKLAKRYGRKISDTIKHRGDLAKALGKAADDAAIEAHHVIPVELIEKYDSLRAAIKDGFEFNGEENGALVRRFSSETRLNEAGDVFADPKGVHASHPNYTASVEDKIAKIENDFNAGKIDGAQAAEKYKKVADQIKKDIAANPKVKLDDLY